MSDVVNMQGQKVEPTETISWEEWDRQISMFMTTTEVAMDVQDQRLRELEKSKSELAGELAKLKIQLMKPKRPFWRRFF